LAPKGLIQFGSQYLQIFIEARWHPTFPVHSTRHPPDQQARCQQYDTETDAFENGLVPVHHALFGRVKVNPSPFEFLVGSGSLDLDAAEKRH
jgi:hypothetical protein